MFRDATSLTATPHRIEIGLRDISQLFNTMDPSPFHEKDLDADAEEFIVSWAQEFPLRAPITLVIHLSQLPEHGNPQVLTEQAVQHYFAYRAKLSRLELRRLLKEGQRSLLVGLGFLAACLVTTRALRSDASGAAWSVARESLTIAGWVAMWHPMQIYLYGWWPVRRRGKIFDKMSRMKVEVRPQPAR